MYDLLMQLPLFQGIGTADLTHILEVIPFEFRTFKNGEVIIEGGDTIEGVTFLLSGSVRLHTPICNSRMNVEQVYEAPYTFSLHHLFGADTKACSMMITETDKAGIMLLRKGDFLRILQENKVALINAMNILSTRAQKQRRGVDFQGESDPVLRLMTWMLTFSDHAAVETTFDAEEEDWCDMLQIDKQTFWRCVAKLEGQHLLDTHGCRLKLLDRYALRTMLRNKTTQK